MLNLARSNYYYRGDEDLQRQKEEADLRDKIEEIVVGHPRYGYRRVTAQLKREGITVNHKRVLRVMQEESLLCKVKKRWITTVHQMNMKYGQQKLLTVIIRPC